MIISKKPYSLKCDFCGRVASAPFPEGWENAGISHGTFGNDNYTEEIYHNCPNCPNAAIEKVESDAAFEKSTAPSIWKLLCDAIRADKLTKRGKNG